MEGLSEREEPAVTGTKTWEDPEGKTGGSSPEVPLDEVKVPEGMLVEKTVRTIEFFNQGVSMGVFPIPAGTNHGERQKMAEGYGIEYFDAFVIDNSPYIPGHRIVCRQLHNYYAAEDGTIWQIDNE